MAKKFVSDDDTNTFLTPTFQFGRREEVEACAADHSENVFDDGFEPFSCKSGSFLPRAFSELSTSLLTSEPHPRGGVRPQDYTIRRKATPMPRGAKNTCLLVEGPRQFHRYVHRTNKRKPSYYRFASGHFDCFAVWGREGRSLGNPLFTEDGRSVFVGRSAWGAIYASVPVFSPDLSIASYDTHLALVEFRVRDSNPALDSVLSCTVHALRSYGHDPKEACKPYGLDPQRYHPFWLELEQRAFEGFAQSCRRMPEKLEAELALYLDQKGKADADTRRPFGTSYRERIKKMDWQEALRSVEEPWQLEIVVLEHADSKFDESPHCYDTTGARVGTMLQQHACTAERRAQLSDMISDFVAPRDTLWNYTGD